MTHLLTNIFPTPIIQIQFSHHEKYKFSNFPKKNKIPDGWETPIYTSFPDVTADDEFINWETICALKKDLTEDINKSFIGMDIPTSWRFANFWYNFYYRNQGQHRHDHVNSLSESYFWSGIYFNKNPTTIKFYRKDLWSRTQNFPKSEDSALKESFYTYWTPDVFEGLILLFPPYLEHEVPLSTNDDMRLTFSFNMLYGQ